METYYCGQHYRKPDDEPIPEKCPVCGNPFLQHSNFQDEIIEPEKTEDINLESEIEPLI